MNTSITQLAHIPRSALLSGLIVLSGVISLGIQTPTHALSLDLGDTVSSVAALTSDVPVVNQITPLLTMPAVTTMSATPTVATSVATPAVSSPPTATATPAATTTLQPITATTLIPAITTPIISTPAVSIPAPAAVSTPKVSTSTPKATTSTPTTAAVVTPVVSAQTLSTNESIAAKNASPVATTSLNSTSKQNEIASAVAFAMSPGITYTTRAIDPKVAGTIFYIGIAGILAGGCIIFALRPRMVAT